MPVATIDGHKVWKRRDRDYRAALSTPAFVTPTSLKRQEQEFS
jgi:hypothetical protein